MNNLFNEAVDYSNYNADTLYEDWVNQIQTQFPELEVSEQYRPNKSMDKQTFFESTPQQVSDKNIAKVQVMVIKTATGNPTYTAVGGSIVILDKSLHTKLKSKNLLECYVGFRSNGESFCIKREKSDLNAMDPSKQSCTSFGSVLQSIKQALREVDSLARRYKNKVQPKDEELEEDIAPKMTPQEQTEAKKAMQEYRNDPERLATYFAAKGYDKDNNLTSNNSNNNTTEIKEDIDDFMFNVNRVVNSPKAKEVEMMDKVLHYMNNMDAIDATPWLMDGPPDEATLDDYEYIAEDDEYYEEVCDLFKRIYTHYQPDGLYDAPDDVVEYAHKKDTEFGLNPIENVKDNMNEDYSNGQEDWGKPYTIKQCEKELSELSNNFTDSEGMVTTERLDQKNLAIEILKAHYKTIEVSDARMDDGEPMSWAIAYSNPREPVQESNVHESNKD